MTEPTFTYRPSPEQLAERIVALAADAPAVNRAAREAVAAWRQWNDARSTHESVAAAIRLDDAMEALAEVTR
jgi:hypothetical protein